VKKKDGIIFYDPQIDVKKELVSNRLQYIANSKIPLPSEIEISESGSLQPKMFILSKK